MSPSPHPRIVEIRPGRRVNVLQWTLTPNKEGASSSTTTRIINLVCVHGTAANHQQFVPLLAELEHQLHHQVTVHCWSYDAIGCGTSPSLPDLDAYRDSEQVEDLFALLSDHVDTTLPTYLLGHSYGPNWIYKFLLSHSSSTSSSGSAIDNIQGLILISSGVANPKYSLQKGGPAIFHMVPLWLLRCIQPLLTKSFLQMGFSQHTQSINPALIADAKVSNNQNDMKIVCMYYQSHDWVCGEDITTKLRDHFPPPLILHGLDDHIVPVECGQELSNAWGVELTTIPNASHMVLMEQPQVMAQHIAQYLVRS